MEKPVLSDPNIFPTDKILFPYLRKAKPSFVSLFEYNHKNFPDLVERWKYYNDGKRWLLNVSRKKKTIFWLSVNEGFFRTTFYFNAKAAQGVLTSKLPKALKDRFRESAGKTFRGITAVIKAKKDIGVYKELLSLKMSSR